MIYVVAQGGVRGRGGIGRIVAYTARALADTPGAPAFRIVDSYGPESFRLMPFYFLAAVMRLFGVFLLGRASLVHLHVAEYGSVLRKGTIEVMAWLFGVPVVLHLHGANFREECEGAGRWHRAALAWLLGHAREIVVLGDYWRDFLQGFFGDGLPPITVLVNAVEGPLQFQPRSPAEPVHILFLGRVGARKGADEFLEALASTPLRSLAWRVTIAGDGEVEAYRARAERLGLGERVTFLGWTEEARSRALLAEADILCLPSRNEGLPMAIIEAMAYGATVLATPVGAVPRAVEDGVTGMLVPPGDAPALATALGRLIEDPALRQRLARAAHQRFLSDFTIQAYCRDLIALYRRTARPRPA